MKQKPFEPKKVAILVCAVLSGLAGVCSRGAAQENWWQLGGEGGVSWTEVADFSLITDDSTTAEALSLSNSNRTRTSCLNWAPGSVSGSPSTRLCRPGHPRLWQGHGDLLLKSRDVQFITHIIHVNKIIACGGHSDGVNFRAVRECSRATGSRWMEKHI